MNPRHIAWAVGLAALIALPFVYREPYHLHILVLILIWSFAYTAWSIMGRFGLVSLGHGGFMGVGAYVTALLWNHLGWSPWIGIPIGISKRDYQGVDLVWFNCAVCHTGTYRTSEGAPRAVVAGMIDHDV